MPWSLPGGATKGVLIQAYGAGNLPMERPDLRALLDHCRERAIPVVMTSFCPWGGVDLATYELGRMAADRGAISGGLHTRWAALAKLGLVLGAGGSLAGGAVGLRCSPGPGSPSELPLPRQAVGPTLNDS